LTNKLTNQPQFVVEKEPCERSVKQLVSMIRAYSGTYFTDDFADDVQIDASFQRLCYLKIGDEIISCMMFTCLDGRPHITAMVTRRDCQSKGYGKRLMGFFVEYVSRLGFHEIELYAWSEKTKPICASTQAFYQSVGFVVIKEHMGLWAPDMVTLKMRKTWGNIDYNMLAKKYDLTRSANIDILDRFAEVFPFEGKTILDFGCGTGNFAHALNQMTTAKVYGVEPSAAMREKAVAKGVDARAGDHTAIPFEDGFFDFIYMTDVIHHVPDLKAMFSEFRRVLKSGGLVGILTESHDQLATRFWVRYFPATVAVERERYPDIPHIIKAAERTGLRAYKTVATDEARLFAISEDFLRLAENKGYSIFHLIEEDEYQTGLAALREDYVKQAEISSAHGETLLFFER